MALGGRLLEQRMPVRYAAATGLAVVAELLRTALHAPLGGWTPLIFLYFPFILGAAVWLGLGPGLSCAALCVLWFDWFWLEPTGSLLVGDPHDVLLIALFSASAALACFMVENGRNRARSGEQQQRLDAEAQMRAQAGAIARDRDARLEAILGTAVEGIITIDERGVVDSVNPAAERMFGYAGSEIVGRNVRMLMPPPYEEQHDEYLQAYLRTGRNKIIGIGREVEGLRKDGSRFPLHLSVSEVQLDGARLFTGFLRDLTEEKRIEAEYLQAQKMEAVGRLAAGVAHDFNNLLAGILGGLRIASESLEPNHPAAAVLREVRDETTRGASITRHLLEFSRTKVQSPRPTNPCDSIRDVEPMIRRLLGEDIEVQLELCTGGSLVLADPSMLEQALVNLAINARDAMPNGGKLLIACREPEPAAGPLGESEHLVVSVEDNGTGMDEATLRRATEPFFTTKQPGTGTGLGLPSVQSAVQAWGGSIELESELGIGTKVRLTLPRVDGRAAPRPKQPEDAPAAAAAGGTILLVEDEKLVRRGIQHMLEQHGYAVLTAPGPEEALEILRAKASAIDLLLTDVILPRLSGPELAAAAREIAPGLSTLFMSAFPQPDLVARGRIPVGTVTLEKPFTEQELFAKVGDAIAGAPAAGSTRPGPPG
jgi:PAS domain S-box-containing protein